MLSFLILALACRSDFNLDGTVNFPDLAQMRYVFFVSTPEYLQDVGLPEDLNRDGIVNFADLEIFKQDFLKPCEHNRRFGTLMTLPPWPGYPAKPLGQVYRPIWARPTHGLFRAYEWPAP